MAAGDERRLVRPQAAGGGPLAWRREKTSRSMLIWRGQGPKSIRGAEVGLLPTCNQRTLTPAPRSLRRSGLLASRGTDPGPRSRHCQKRCVQRRGGSWLAVCNCTVRPKRASSRIMSPAASRIHLMATIGRGVAFGPLKIGSVVR